MARVKKGVNAHKRHKKVLKMAKGFYGAKSKTFKAAKPATMRALRSAYVGRKNKKREYRKLWIARINAAARMNGISYSRLMDGLKKSNIDINRKIPVGEYIITDMDVTAGSRSYAEKGRSCDNLRRHPHCRKYGDRRRDHVHNSGDPQKMASGSFLYMQIRSRMCHVRIVFTHRIHACRRSCEDDCRGMFRSAAVSCGVRET